MSTKSDVLIAKFMGLHPIKGISEWTKREYYYYNCPIMKDFEALPDYGNSWGSLMKVVEKVEDTKVLTDKKSMVSVRIVDNICIVEHDAQHAICFDEITFEDILVTRHTKILAVYDALVEFIEWHTNFVKTLEDGKQ